jgi:hypothetical protein
VLFAALVVEQRARGQRLVHVLDGDARRARVARVLRGELEHVERAPRIAARPFGECLERVVVGL